MDGCLVNLQKGIDIYFESLGYSRDKTKILTNDEMEGEYGMSSTLFWKLLDKSGHDFWANLEPFYWALDLYNLCTRYCKNVTIMSTPSFDPYSAAGKITWLNRHLNNGKAFRNYTLTCNKHLFATPDALLIDDRFSVTDKFRDAGGQVFMIPQFYNQNVANYEGDLFEDAQEKLSQHQHKVIYEQLPALLSKRCV